MAAELQTPRQLAQEALLSVRTLTFLTVQVMQFRVSL